MEALWDLEDKLKLSTRGAILLLVSASFAIVAFCTLLILKMKAHRNKIVHQDEIESAPLEWSERGCGWISVRRVVMRSKLWCSACKWEENIVFGLERHGLELGRQSHNSVSAVWQRPILRGEKCELPSFSGLILYDEKGRLLRDSEMEIDCNQTSNQDKAAVRVRTTLKDLL